MTTFLYHLLRSMRPRQWLKNVSVASPLVFSGYLFIPEKFFLTIIAIIVFCMVSSSIYVFNDIMDRESDRKHPFKRLRPIAAGKITVPQAFVTAILLAITSLSLAVSINIFFFLTILTYVLMQILYSIKLKHISIIDLFVIAAGFVLRIYAGGIAIDTHMSIWFNICVIATALLIAVGKRRAELAILTDQAATHRAVLSRYTPDVLNSYVSMFANAAFISWSLFTFFAPPLELSQSYPTLFSLLPTSIAGHNKWLMVTIPVVIYGIMRYIRIIYDGSKAESPERILLTDKPLLATAFIWVSMIIVILYVIPSGS